ncbi:MAG: hypothetical protein ACK56F_14460 [bacterium]
MIVQKFEGDLGGKKHIIHVDVVRVQPLHHVGDLVIVTGVNSVPQTSNACKLLACQLVNTALHSIEGFAHNTRKGEASCITCQHINKLDLLQSHHFVIGIRIELLLLICISKSLEIHAPVSVRVALHFVER